MSCFKSLSEIQMIARVTGFHSKLSKVNKSYQVFPKAFKINTFCIPNEYGYKNRCSDLFFTCFLCIELLEFVQ